MNKILSLILLNTLTKKHCLFLQFAVKWSLSSSWANEQSIIKNSKKFDIYYYIISYSIIKIYISLVPQIVDKSKIKLKTIKKKFLQ